MITHYDDGIIAFYLVFVLSLGLVFRRLSANTSDYFRCGGVIYVTGAILLVLARRKAVARVELVAAGTHE